MFTYNYKLLTQANGSTILYQYRSEDNLVRPVSDQQCEYLEWTSLGNTPEVVPYTPPVVLPKTWGQIRLKRNIQIRKNKR